MTAKAETATLFHRLHEDRSRCCSPTHGTPAARG